MDVLALNIWQDRAEDATMSTANQKNPDESIATLAVASNNEKHLTQKTADAPLYNDSIGPNENIITRVWDSKHFKPILRLVEVAGILLTFFFLAYQNQQMYAQNDLTVTNAIKDHYQRVNHLLLDRKEVRDALQINDLAATMAYILITDYEWLFTLRKKGFIEEEHWTVMSEFIKQTMRGNPKIAEVWYSPDNVGRLPEFKRYIDTCIFESSDHLPLVNALKPKTIPPIDPLPHNLRVPEIGQVPHHMIDANVQKQYCPHESGPMIKASLSSVK
jgi:hypothetical protein